MKFLKGTKTHQIIFLSISLSSEIVLGTFCCYSESNKKKCILYLFSVTAECDKKVNDGKEIDMVDSSGAGVDYLMHRPEEETVMLLKNDERLLSKSNKRNDKQTNCDYSGGSNSDSSNSSRNGGGVTLDKRNKDEKLREKSATNDDKFTGLNRSGNNQSIPQTMTHTAKDSFVDDLDDDPYAELQSYLDKVKVSSFFFLLFFGIFFFLNCRNMFKT